MADPRVQERLERYQIFRPEVDLSQPRRTSHAEYWYNLHIVMVNDERYMEIRDEVLTGLRAMILRASDAKGHSLSRAGIVPDHIHLTLGCSLEESPEAVVLSYMNNLGLCLRDEARVPIQLLRWHVQRIRLGRDSAVVQNHTLHRASSAGAEGCGAARRSAESHAPPSKLGGGGGRGALRRSAESHAPPSKLGGGGQGRGGCDLVQVPTELARWNP